MSDLSLFRHVTPVLPQAATGSVAAVYDHVNTEFSSIGPAVMMMSPAPELLTAGWALLRESLVAGSVPRWRKEIVTVAVSQENGCDYDIAGHLMFLRLAGGSEAADALERGEDPGGSGLVGWVRSGGRPPFSAAEAPEYIGTALALHFVNRFVAVLINPDLHPGDMRQAAFEGGPIARAIHQDRTPGDSLRLLDSVPDNAIPEWAGDSPVGPAYAALRAAALRGAGLLSETAQNTVQEAIAAQDLTRAEDPGAHLAILAGLAPARITDADIAGWRAGRYPDHCLLHLLAYGAITAIGHIERKLW
ncbi:MAG: carboxymuconolactone decarboxylase family protein [Kibdelosporangium sp.]